MRVIGYARVSTEEQASTGVSLAAQVEKIRQYAGLYDLELLDVIEDAGQSAKTLNRPGLQQALLILRSGEAGGLLVAKLDRLTRSVSDMSSLIRDYFGDRSQHAASLLSVADQVDTRTAAGRLVLNILTSVSEWEREAIGERTRVALQYKKAQGVRLGAPALGATPAEIETLRHIVQLRAEGMTLQQIAAHLNTDEWKTKRGGRWHPMTVSNALKRAVEVA